MIDSYFFLDFSTTLSVRICSTFKFGHLDISQECKQEFMSIHMDILKNALNKFILNIEGWQL